MAGIAQTDIGKAVSEGAKGMASWTVLPIVTDAYPGMYLR